MGIPYFAYSCIVVKLSYINVIESILFLPQDTLSDLRF